MFHSYGVMFSLLSIVPLSCRLKIHCDFLFHYNFDISVCPLKVQKTKTENGVRHVHSVYPFCRMKTWSSMINSVGKHSKSLTIAIKSALQTFHIKLNTILNGEKVKKIKFKVIR